MGARSRRKGAAGEREIVRFAKASGLDARRSWELWRSYAPRRRPWER